jgi:hypothetical protein
VKAVTLILKHATLLQTSNVPGAALTNVELNYQKANIDELIQQYLKACASELSVEQFADFIMGTDISLFIFLFLITSISHCSLVSSQSSAKIGILRTLLVKLTLNPIKSRFNVPVVELCIMH